MMTDFFRFTAFPTIAALTAAASFGPIYGATANRSSSSGARIAYHEGDGERPNLLWIISDDLGPELGCYGYKDVHTPNLDKLAAEGMRFTRVFATSPVCSPSRSALITGIYQTSIGVHDHRPIDSFPDLPQDVEALPELLRNVGYFTSNQGDPMGMHPIAKIDYNFNFTLENLFSGHAFTDAPSTQPFFGQVQLYPPHRPFVNEPLRNLNPDALTLPPYYPDDSLLRRDWAAYLQTIELLDLMVGETLAQLEATGRADNTIVIFFGDNGRPHLRNKQWLYEGGLHVPMIIRWPGRIEPGRVYEHLTSLVDVAPTCLEWLGFKIPHWMQGRSFAHLAEPHRDFVYAARDRCGDAVDKVRSIRNNRYKYIRNFRPELPYTQSQVYIDTYYPAAHVLRQLQATEKLPPDAQPFMQPVKATEEMYDLRQDPYEQNNLAENPAYADEKEHLIRHLDQWLEQTDRTAEFSEPDNRIESYLLMRQEVYNKWLMERGLSTEATPAEIVDWWQQYYK